MPFKISIMYFFVVAPYAGAWIEICFHRLKRQPSGSLPTRERGLKWLSLLVLVLSFYVAPNAGAWIEISK